MKDRKTWKRSTSQVRIALFCLPLLATPALQARPQASKDSPDTIRILIEQAAGDLAKGERGRVSDSLRKIVRKDLTSPNRAVRKEAVLVLGYSKDPVDQRLVLDQARGKDSEMRARALIALGLSGGSIGSFHLGRVLEDKDASSREKSFALIALGLEEGYDTAIAIHAQNLTRFSARRHLDELAASVFGFTEDSGRAFLTNYLRGPTTGGVAEEASTGKKRSAGEEQVRALLFGRLASLAATSEQMRIVHNEFKARRKNLHSPLRIAYGLYRNDHGLLKKRDRSKLTTALKKRMRSKDPELSILSFLAIGTLDRKLGLKMARQTLAAKSARTEFVAASYLLLGKLGEAKDQALLLGHGDQARSALPTAAWCLAVAEMQRRLAPAKWPMSKESDGTDGAKQPVPALRKLLATGPTGIEIVRVAASIALAKLGDRESANNIRDLYRSAEVEWQRRCLALAQTCLSPEKSSSDRDPSEKGASLDWKGLSALAAAGHPLLWKPLLYALDSEETSDEDRARLLRLAHIALGGPGQRLQDLILEKLGPGDLPGIFREAAAWQTLPTLR